MMIQPPVNLRTFQALRQVVEALRGPNGCPWDKEQTHRTLTPYAIEEAFELVEAIEQGDDKALTEELGDYLFQVLLHAEIARQEERFSIDDVLESINTKMVRRHPHVFSRVEVKDSAEVLANWAVLKAQEKPKPTPSFGIPVQLPSLQKAHKIGRKSQDFDFDWSNDAQVLAKVDEEMGELKKAMGQGNRVEEAKELGDLLFSLAQLARHRGYEAEQALRETNHRFEARFFGMLDLAVERGVMPQGLTATEQLGRFKALSPAQKEELWEGVKEREQR